MLLRQKNIGLEDSERYFAERMMPGFFYPDQSFLGTSLNIADVLSLDRLKWWFDYSASDNSGLIESLDWDRAYVSLDFDSPYPLIVSDISDGGITKTCVAVKTNSIRIREFVQYAKHLLFDEYLVDSEEDAAFLRKTIKTANITVRKLKRDGKKQVEYPKKEKLRTAMGIKENANLTAVFFDRRDEWQCRRFLSELDDSAWVFPVDQRSKELAPSVLWQYARGITIQNDTKLLAACDSLISFRWDDRYYNDLPMELTIIDYLGINRSYDVAPEGVKVIS